MVPNTLTYFFASLKLHLLLLFQFGDLLPQIRALLITHSTTTCTTPPPSPPLLRPGQLCTATWFHWLLTLLSGGYYLPYFTERGTSLGRSPSLYPDVLHIPHTTETLTYVHCRHTLGFRLLALHSALDTENRKITHMSLPTTLWLLSTLRIYIIGPRLGKVNNWTLKNIFYKVLNSTLSTQMWLSKALIFMFTPLSTLQIKL
jgi:hypothetical protein